MTEQLLFYFFSCVAVVFALLMLTRKNPLTGAVCLVICFLSFAGIYAMLGAQLIALMQVLVYSGAIMMLIIFVIMMVNLRPEELKAERPVPAGCLAGAALLVLSMTRFHGAAGALSGSWPHTPDEPLGTIETIGYALFTRHVVAFELISVLLLVALAGAVYLGRGGRKQ